jgi:hypothetical protein
MDLVRGHPLPHLSSVGVVILSTSVCSGACYSAMSGHDELVAQFVGVTNATATEAEHLLEAAGWDLDSAVQLHFDGAAAAATAAAPSPAVAVTEDVITDLDELVNSSRVARARPQAIGADGVRVADSVKRERLFDTRHARQPRVSMPHGGPEVQHMPFGDLDPNAASRSGPGLETIYQPPMEILCGLPLNECVFRSWWFAASPDCAGVLILGARISQ